MERALGAAEPFRCARASPLDPMGDPIPAKKRLPAAARSPEPPIADEELVARARTGDRWAHEAIFRRHVEPVMGMATRLLGRSGEADDVAQETFVTALTRLDRLEEPRRLRSWLLGIAVHRVKRRLRARRLLCFVGLAEDDGGLFDLASSEASPETRADLALIDAQLARLPVEERIAWALRHVEGEKLEDIAAITGASLATVKRRIAAVEVRMRATIAREGGGS